MKLKMKFDDLALIEIANCTIQVTKTGEVGDWAYEAGTYRDGKLIALDHGADYQTVYEKAVAYIEKVMA